MLKKLVVFASLNGSNASHNVVGKFLWRNLAAVLLDGSVDGVFEVIV